MFFVLPPQQATPSNCQKSEPVPAAINKKEKLIIRHEMYTRRLYETR